MDKDKGRKIVQWWDKAMEIYLTTEEGKKLKEEFINYMLYGIYEEGQDG